MRAGQRARCAGRGVICEVAEAANTPFVRVTVFTPASHDELARERPELGHGDFGFGASAARAAVTSSRTLGC